ncbi:hypothetical protein L3X38_009657 [Prunus dulcis]|uniref:Uncharacterized protein n=1 Tax=Prunus dulcis TaxID=3755 RepID=A0AAD4ZCK6_PRUDU|nr:hypothetical protein L3X38_009657 [Prunus dulcis]
MASVSIFWFILSICFSSSSSLELLPIYFDSTHIWDAYNVKGQSFKTAIEAACLLLRIDDIVSGMKKKQPPGAKAPSKPQVETEGDADNEQMIPECLSRARGYLSLNEVLL